MRLIAKFERAFDVTLNALGLMVAAIVLYFVVFIVLNWLLRVIGHSPISWVRDLVEYLLFAGVLLGAPWVLRQNAHIRVDLILTVLPPAARRLLEQFLDALGFLICAAIGLFSTKLAIELIQDHSFIRKTITIDSWVLQAVIVVSMVLCMIEFLFRMFRPATREPSPKV